jgi:hypothetical protein
MTRPIALAASLALLATGCKASRTAPAPAATPAAPAPAAQPSAFVTAATVVRREPADAAKVRGPTGKDVPNTVALLQRGEAVTVLEAREDWLHVRTSDDQQGWLKSAAVLQGEGIVPATVLTPADVFDRPDLLAANARRRLDPGALLLVVKQRAPFSEVNVGGGPNAWVLTERLATGEREVSAAKLVEKARFLERSKRHEEAKQVLALAREHFAGVPIVDVLAQELGEAPPAAAFPGLTDPAAAAAAAAPGSAPPAQQPAQPAPGAAVPASAPAGNEAR